MWCWRRIDQLGRSYEKWRSILQRVKRRGIFYKKSKEGTLTGKHVIEWTVEGRIEVTGRLARRRAKLLDGLKEKRG